VRRLGSHYDNEQIAFILNARRFRSRQNDALTASRASAAPRATGHPDPGTGCKNLLVGSARDPYTDARERDILATEAWSSDKCTHAVPDPGAAIEAVRASKLFQDGSVVAFQGLTLSVTNNRVLCIVGPSGCGKTTFLRCVAGLTGLSTGELLVEGKPVDGPPAGVAMVFQQFGLLPWKTVFDNVAFGLAMAGAPAATIREKVTHYLHLVGLKGFDRHYPYQLSGGMQQRVGFARALALNPRILLMDEPFAALDAQTREVLQEELLRLTERPDERKTVVFITHSIDEALLLGDQVVVLTARPGRVRELIDLSFGRPRDPAAVRADRQYSELREHIWNELRPEVALVEQGTA
jgi:NitT/TauT family transport system ATP-binding protein